MAQTVSKTGMRGMRNKIGMMILAALVVSGAGCGPVQLAQYGGRRFIREANGIRFDTIAAEPLRGDLSAYQRLEVEPLRNEMEEKIPAELVTSLNDQLFRQLSQVKHFEVVRTQPPDGASGGPATIQDSGQLGARLDGQSAPPGSLSESATASARTEARKQSTPAAAPAPQAVILRGSIVDFDAGKQSLRVLQAGVGREGTLTLHLSFVDAASGEVVGKYVVNTEVRRLGSKRNVGVDKLAKGVGELVAKLVAQRNPQATNSAAREQR